MEIVVDGSIEWINDYGNKGMNIIRDDNYTPVGGYTDIDLVNNSWVSKESESGKLRWVEVMAHSSYSFKDTTPVYSGKWYVRGNQANRNIVATELSFKQAKTMAYKIIDMIISDDTVCQVSIIEQ